jgi:hypothetical protein
MSFLTEFVSNFIKRSLMEDPVARREARNKHIAEVSAKAAELCVPSRAGRRIAWGLHGRALRGAAGRSAWLRKRRSVRWVLTRVCVRLLPEPQQGVVGAAAQGAGLLARGRQQRGGALSQPRTRCVEALRSCKPYPALSAKLHAPTSVLTLSARGAQYFMNLRPSLARMPGRRDPY